MIIVVFVQIATQDCFAKMWLKLTDTRLYSLEWHIVQNNEVLLPSLGP